ncbi:MerR family transcriptional regulator [Paramuribaculum intestinale]|uniref:MerR family transcriptional regulator n=1 Tax=Paramuribaculum intestinale TaxID=2094151 RepID=UPI0025AA1B35|nr:MerR family transcriptional regulator [Paramuribaculum intestinale]
MDPIDKKFYKIGEVAELTGLPVSTLRFWEQQFTIIKPRRNDRGTRFYTPDDVERIRMIHYLVKHRGLKLDAAQEELRRNPEGVSRKSQAVTRLMKVRAKLCDMIKALDSLR